LENSKPEMESFETTAAIDGSASSEQCCVKHAVGNLYPEYQDSETRNRCFDLDIISVEKRKEDCYIKSLADVSNGKPESSEHTTNKSHSTSEGLDVHNKGIVFLEASEDNLRSNIHDLGSNKFTSNEFVFPVENLIKDPYLKVDDAVVKCDYLLNTSEELHNQACMPANNSFWSSLSIIDNSGDLETCSAMPPALEDDIALSEHCRELCAEGLFRRDSGSKPGVSLPLGDDVNKRKKKRKQRNRKRKRESRGVDMEGEQTE